MRITFIVPGGPQGKGRPRFMRSGHTYTPEKTRKYEKLIREAYKLQSGIYLGDDVPVGIRITAFFPIPKSYTKKQRMLITLRKLLPLKKPDGDNIEKAVLDALNGLAFKDDTQVTDMRWSKRYAYGDDRSECLIVTITDEVITDES